MFNATPLITEPVQVPEAIVRVLEEAGIDMVFGLSGGNTNRFFKALYHHTDTIRTTLVREESLACTMAQTYGRLTGRPGVAIGQSCFLWANGGIGILEAHLGSSPMLLLGDLSDNAPFTHHAPYQAASALQGNWDARQVFNGITKATFEIHGAAEAVQLTQQAIRIATGGNPGPVALLFHSSALDAEVGPESVPTLYSHRSYNVEQVAAAPDVIQAAATMLDNAECPAIIVGGGVQRSAAFDSLEALAVAIGAPVASSATGKSALRETHDLAAGVYGTFGTSVANQTIGKADVVLAIGTKLSPTDTAFEHPDLLDPSRQQIIHVDIEPSNANWTFPAALSLASDARLAMDALRKAVSPDAATKPSRIAWLDALAAAKDAGFYRGDQMAADGSPIHPQRAIAELQQALPEDGFLTGDAGENRLFMNHYFKTKRSGSLVQPAAAGGMGYAIPAALAIKAVHPDQPVVALCGDGGFAMSMNGLLTAVEEKLPIVVVILNNRCLGWVKHGQGENNIAVDFADFDHAAIAESMGCFGIRVTDAADIAEALAAALEQNVPAVVELMTSETETFLDVMSPLAVARKP